MDISYQLGVFFHQVSLIAESVQGRYRPYNFDIMNSVLVALPHPHHGRGLDLADARANIPQFQMLRLHLACRKNTLLLKRVCTPY